MRFQGTKKNNFWWQRLSRDDGLQSTNEHLLIIAVFGRTIISDLALRGVGSCPYEPEAEDQVFDGEYI
jgi:hypothetical protein